MITVKLLETTVDNKLFFELHLNEACEKVSQKVHALARVWKLISQKKLRVTMGAFITSQFSCCLFGMEEPQQNLEYQNK